VGDWLLLTLVAVATALATGIGALPVIWLGTRAARWTPLLWGLAALIMSAAAIFGLLAPAIRDGGTVEATTGALTGAVLFGAARVALERRADLHLGTLTGADARRGLLVFGALLAHSLPEGLAIGAAWAQEDAIGVFVVLAIALQNVPEGMVTAVPLREGAMSANRTFWLSAATSAPQVPGALMAYGAVTVAESVTGFSYGLAAGAMLALVALEALPAVRLRGASAPSRAAVRRPSSTATGAAPRTRARALRCEPDEHAAGGVPRR
jgi:ZIP family zinc transporter